LAKIPIAAVYRAHTLIETRGFLKVLIDTENDRILGFTALGAEAGEIIAVVQVAAEGIGPLFASLPSVKGTEMKRLKARRATSLKMLALRKSVRYPY
jgi:hypothetical protein